MVEANEHPANVEVSPIPDAKKVNDLKRKTLWERRGFCAALAQIAHNATQTDTNPVASISVAT
jgi:hypothetical protein